MEAHETKLTKAEKRILRALAGMPGMTATQLASACDLHRVYATRLVKKLIAAGMVTRQVAHPTYAVTAQAQNRLTVLIQADTSDPGSQETT